MSFVISQYVKSLGFKSGTEDYVIAWNATQRAARALRGKGRTVTDANVRRELARDYELYFGLVERDLSAPRYGQYRFSPDALAILEAHGLKKATATAEAPAAETPQISQAAAPERTRAPVIIGEAPREAVPKAVPPAVGKTPPRAAQAASPRPAVVPAGKPVGSGLAEARSSDDPLDGMEGRPPKGPSAVAPKPAATRTESPAKTRAERLREQARQRAAGTVGGVGDSPEGVAVVPPAGQQGGTGAVTAPSPALRRPAQVDAPQLRPAAPARAPVTTVPLSRATPTPLEPQAQSAPLPAAPRPPRSSRTEIEYNTESYVVSSPRTIRRKITRSPHFWPISQPMTDEIVKSRGEDLCTVIKKRLDWHLKRYPNFQGGTGTIDIKLASDGRPVEFIATGTFHPLILNDIEQILSRFPFPRPGDDKTYVSAPLILTQEN